MSTTEATSKKIPNQSKNNVHCLLRSRAKNSSEYKPATSCCETP